MAKMTLEELRKLRESKKTDLRKRDTEGKNIQIIVGMGTCGIAAGAKATLDAFLKLLDEKHLVDQVMVRQTGCMGLCHSEPTVEVVVPGMPTIIYGKVDAAAAAQIVEKHIIGRELVNNLILDRPAADIIAK
ncbi:MAG TPA: (2Fe-2S) ferredoxin domain-containing protein [Termitinemataceae bacterium]|uniref:(2Fe-2S) ferredoxin domain-containing protein n=1 Tax=Treponema sp. J25 TaxID=2094121 RepID=UPI001046D585|nr:(2Fe-2S) ferredoxin domain-containing protein [Treponema sp. J25]TCW61778.1 NAD(P)-dependent iron-only hydrogenase iron-sulfur protein [Treponema sp. J25]HOJ99576.1 (2Fe-2S) ferredoxin domain-containing protein [Termitinemataceae bacterium]HOM23679.1 (2Fe-2S) ferredoxin domain-containing protein [Termitinemataceae bacterium]HPP99420.1 (2Fe-2S) ferredoxin domain-containing protein [Termitinemataceae bacterium]